MYNDYYLQEISNKMTINNNRLQEIINNQEAIILNQETLISGDREIIQNQNFINANIVGAQIGIMLALIYTFITRSMKA